jgi:4-hydroxy-2-oxoheptanedioate aldolase
MMRAARVGGADIIARPAKGEFMRMARLLEAGATGILYPRCESAEEAREVVRWAKFAPLGERGADGANADMPYLSMNIADYIRVANEETFIAVQIESPNAVKHCQEIAAVEGVDMLFFGPGDYSILAGIPGQLQSEPVLKATEEVCRVAREAGKQFGTTSRGPEHIQWLVEIGATFLTHGADIVMLKAGYESIRQTLTDAGCQFGS